jgi:integrase
VRGIRRTLGTAKTKKTPATAERLLAMAANTGAGLKGLRDRALLLLGFAGAFRRSELVALDVSDIEETPDGMKVTIRPSKTDQEGAGQVVAIPFGKIACPISALKEWTAAAGIQSGAIFRSVNRHGRPRYRRAAEQRDELAALHSISSSAVESSVCGTVRPSSFAVFKLITSSNFVGTWTGNSPGFAPLRMRST